MPRKARVILSNTAHHIVQRGHNRAAVFIEEQDYLHYLSILKEWKEKFGTRMYGYCLMTNHVHLILDPAEDVTSIGKLMKRLAGRYTRYFNHQERRTGSVWEGRYKSSPIETEHYLKACSRYVDMNPVRAGMVKHPGEYPWSSYRQKVGMDTEKWIDADACFQGLSPYPKVRQRLYAEYVSNDISEGEQTFIGQALNRGQLTGSHRFIDEVESRIGIRVEHRGQGRPSKSRKGVTSDV